MIEVQQITRFFGRVKAVDNVSFQVEKGEILGFLGPNAAGKTTTMRILTTYLPATHGRATVAGYDVHTDSMKVREHIGYMPENPPLYQEMRVIDFLNFVAKIKGVGAKDIRSAVTEVMGKTDIENVKNRVIKQLSKGYKQRVGLAQALVHNPDVLILDEPTVGLDPKQIIEVRELIKSLAGDHTIILSTHILPEVSMTCERVVIIDKGKVVAEDTPDNLTKALAGAERLNLIVKGPKDKIDEKLTSFQDINLLTSTAKKSNLINIQIESKAKEDYRPLIAKTIIESGWDLYELKSEGVSLEDVFLHVTTREEGTGQ
jgi:ABC-2 type transport system ATP-binding protein